jgi:hypothetical protein
VIMVMELRFDEDFDDSGRVEHNSPSQACCTQPENSSLTNGSMRISGKWQIQVL